MTFKDLPEDVRDVPLTEATLQANIIDLILGIEERRGGALGLMLCDDAARGVQPVVLSDIPEGSPAADLSRLLDLLLPMVGEAGGAVLIGRGRRRGLTATDLDRAWHQAAIDACGRHGVRLLGFFLASPGGVEQLPEPLSAAS